MFQETLKIALGHVPGARGAMLIGLDGITVAKAFAEGAASLEGALVAMTAELGNVLRKLHRHHELGEMPAPREIALHTDDFCLVGRIVDEYILLVAVDPAEDAQTGVRMVRLLAPEVLREMA